MHPRRRHWPAYFATGMALLLVIVLAGPRNSFGNNQPTPRPVPPLQLSQLDAWLSSQEASTGDVRPEAAKQIVWAHADKRKTDWSIVYLHGFSATRQETAPLADRVAQTVGANLYYARLAGHGLPGDALGSVTPQDWLADVFEANAIGHQLGDKVVVIGCSTGATLATWLSLQPDGKAIAAQVFISPNFGPLDSRAEIVNWPWGRELVTAIEGDYREWQAKSVREQENWTTRYPTRAVFPMMALVKAVRDGALETIETPTYMLYSPADQVISPDQVGKAFARFGSPVKKLEAVTYSTSSSQHVLAGDIKSPDATEPMATSISAWIKALPASTTTLR